MQDRAYMLDTLIYPFGLCWFFYLEVRLKTLLVQLQVQLEETPRKDFTHDLQRLWSQVEPLVMRAAPGEEPEDRRQVSRVLAQFAALDPGSEAFRYERDRKGNPTLDGVDRLAVPAMHEALRGVAAWLDAVADKLYYEQEMRADYEMKMHQEADGLVDHD